MTEVKAKQAVPQAYGGQRLDLIAAELFPDFSRSRIQAWIRKGELTVNGGKQKASARLLGGEWIEIDAIIQPEKKVEPQAIPLDIIYQDTHLLIVNKPHGLVVHPALGHPDGTLQNGLLHYDPALAEIPRAGIVHRLDKDTSGVMMIARSLKAHPVLVEALAERRIKRIYQALVLGELVAGGSVKAPLDRHPKDRVRRAVVEGGKPALTHYRVLERYGGLSWLEVRLETGRTHQIRVHMAHIGYPLVGDPLYGGRGKAPKGLEEEQKAVVRSFSRQALHARRLILDHPVSGETMEFEAPLPEDMASLLASVSRK